MRNIHKEFVLTNIFDRCWESLGLDDDDLAELEILIIKNPDKGAVIKNSGGCRKIRFALDGKGKSGGAELFMSI